VLRHSTTSIIHRSEETPMRRSNLWTIALLALATALAGCAPFVSRMSPSGEMLRAPNDSVVVAYEAGRRAAMKANRGRATEYAGWLAAPAGFVAAHVTHADWMRAATAIAVSGTSVVMAYRQSKRPALQAPDSMRIVLGSDRMWDAYRRGFQYEADSRRSTALTRASASAGGTILSYGIAPLITKTDTRP
jgi:hypothetical protein